MKVDIFLLLAGYSNLGNPDNACHRLSEMSIPSTELWVLWAGLVYEWERKAGRASPYARFEYGLLGPHVTEFQSQMFFQAHPLPLAPPARLGCVRLKLNYI